MKNLARLTFAIHEQNTLTDLKAISSSKAFEVLKDQLEKSRAELDHCRTLLEKLQVVNAQYIFTCHVPYSLEPQLLLALSG